MAATVEFSAGGYSFIPGVFQYSAGVGALAGYTDPARAFPRAPAAARRVGPYRAFHTGSGPAADRVLRVRTAVAGAVHRGRVFAPSTDLCRELQKWGVLTARSIRSRAAMCAPSSTRPPSPRFHAFCFTSPARDAAPSFVIAGSGEARKGDGEATRPHRPPRRTSADGMREKAASCSARWSGGWPRSACPGPTPPRRRSIPCTTSIRFSPTSSCGAAPPSGLTWHYARPPVRDLEYEMDCRRGELRTRGVRRSPS